LMRKILSSPDSFHYQLIYTRIDRDRNNRPHFHNQYLRVNSGEYFNPASTVKLPLALLALEKIHTLKKYGVTRNTTMLTDSAFAGQTKVSSDSSSRNGLPSIEQYIKKIFLVSDNDAYNRLYEFLGQQYINETLRKKGYLHTRITRRFVAADEEQNRHTNPIRFVDGERLLYAQPPQISKLTFDFSKKILVGKAHYDRDEELINEPMDFTTHNDLPLEDLQQMMQAALFPASVAPEKRFDLDSADYLFLHRYMSELPGESRFPTYDTTEFFNSYTKFFIFRSGKSVIPPGIRVFSKAGWSYGFLTEVAYIVDFDQGVEFMLTGSIYVNRDEVLNDNKYEYDEIGYPFFKEVGETIMKKERARKKRYKPDFKQLLFSYH
ncbi:MAG: serine hydrolase, partial [Chitinophagaceae bacterium]